MRPNRAAAFETAPLHELLAILLRQLRRPLKTHGLDLTDRDAAELAQALVRREPLPTLAEPIREALAALVAESQSVLSKWGLSFQESLETPMDRIPGWETTAEFLDVANEKANAELRISSGAILLTALGDRQHVRDVLFLAEKSHLPGEADLEHVLARRVLLFAAGIDSADAAWMDRLRAWADQLAP
jgi:hypothetical protein